MSATKISLPLLDRVQIASPCSASWEQMTGDDRKRFCGQCKLHVYNLSAMTAADAEALLQAGSRNQARTCVRLYRRPDGRVLTQDCPVGLRRIRLGAVRAVAAITAFLFGGLAMAAAGTRLSDWAQKKHQNANATMGIMPMNPAMGDMMVSGEAICPPEKFDTAVVSAESPNPEVE